MQIKLFLRPSRIEIEILRSKIEILLSENANFVLKNCFK